VRAFACLINVAKNPAAKIEKRRANFFTSVLTTGIAKCDGNGCITRCRNCDLVTQTLPDEIELDISKIAAIISRNERRHFLFDRPSKAARLRGGARVVAIESDRFPTGR
jgi:hypothetical protein